MSSTILKTDEKEREDGWLNEKKAE